MLDSLLGEPTDASLALAAVCTTLQLVVPSIWWAAAWALRSMSLMLAQLLCSAKLIAVQPCISTSICICCLKVFLGEQVHCYMCWSII